VQGGNLGPERGQKSCHKVTPEKKWLNDQKKTEGGHINTNKNSESSSEEDTKNLLENKNQRKERAFWHGQFLWGVYCSLRTFPSKCKGLGEWTALLGCTSYWGVGESSECCLGPLHYSFAPRIYQPDGPVYPLVGRLKTRREEIL